MIQAVSVLIERFVFKYYSNGYSYIVSKQSLSSNDARKFCQTIQGDLTVIPDKHTLHFLADLLVRESTGTAHIGLARHPKNLHNFFWVDGSGMVFTSWETNEPSNLDEGCAELFAGSISYNDINCETNLKPFVCQQSIQGCSLFYLKYSSINFYSI